MEKGSQTLRFRLACVASLLCGGAAVALGQNLVGNGTFARDFTGWQPRTTANGTAVWSAEDADGAPASGSAFFVGTVPIVLARIFDDAGAAGTSGFTEFFFEPLDVAGGPVLEVTGFLLGPADVDRFRYNVGVRTLDTPVFVTVDVLDPSGAVVHTVARTYQSGFFQQTSVADFTGGFPRGDGYALKITFSGGGLIVYGATVDNVTNDPSAQFLAYRILIS